MLGMYNGQWGTGISRLMRGFAIIPQGNQEPLVVKTRMEDPR